MELPVVIVPLPNQAGYSARLTVPIELSADAPTAEEAHERLAALLKDRLTNGLEIRSLKVPSAPPPGGWLPDDDLTREWLQHIKDYRAECDARDREELEQLERADEASK